MLKKNEYIEFDIELAKQDDCKICTRYGAKVKILTLEAVNYKPIVALVTRYNGTEDVVSYYKSGRLVGSRRSEDDLVIMREKPQKTFVGYANLYKNGQLGEVFKTEKEANDLSNNENYVATILIEY